MFKGTSVYMRLTVCCFLAIMNSFVVKVSSLFDTAAPTLWDRCIPRGKEFASRSQAGSGCCGSCGLPLPSAARACARGGLRSRDGSFLWPAEPSLTRSEDLTRRDCDSGVLFTAVLICSWHKSKTF